MKSTGGSTLQKISRLLAAPTVDPGQRAARIRAVETDVILPIKLLLGVLLAYYFFFSNWFDDRESLRQRVLDLTRSYFWIYALSNLTAGGILILAKKLSLTVMEWLVFGIGLLDAILLCALTGLTSGSESLIYWIFPALIFRNALAIPVALPQLLLNFVVSFSFVFGDLIAQRIGSMSEESRPQTVVERFIVLLLWSFCCYGIQVLFERQKRAEAEATEFAVRQERLHTAGRFAAEIAHKIKNPLGIITNAAFSLEYAVREGQSAVEEQIAIIREEVERADRILTELMGYAQLAEGRVERLDVPEQLDQAIREVLPAAAKYQVLMVTHYAPTLPSLLMQKRHFSDIMVNVLQNAREAMDGKGQLDVAAQYGNEDSVLITISDTGPGIPPDKIGHIFDPYFTTRQKGTGLGLAIVKHNVEMYGGTIRVQSELGKGTRFILEFPGRILMKLQK